MQQEHDYAKRPKAALNMLGSHLGAHSMRDSEPQHSNAQIGGVRRVAPADGENPAPPEIEARPRDGTPNLPALKTTARGQFQDGTMRSYTWAPVAECASLPEFLLALERRVARFVETDLIRRPQVAKLLLDVDVEYARLVDNQIEPVVRAVLRTPAKAVTPAEDGSTVARKLCDVLWQRNQNFVSQKSGLIVFRIHWGKAMVGSYNPLRGASYVQLPKRIQAKKATVNVKNTDERCFGYAILACKYADKAYKGKACEPKQYDKYFAAEGLDRLAYPVGIADLDEAENRLNIPINVFSFPDDKGDGMFPAYLSHKNRKEAINLLYWQGHYSWIKDFPRLMSSVTAHQGRKHFCMQCIGHFSSAQVLAKHESVCTGEACQQTIAMMPEGSVLQFTNVRYQDYCPFVVYADFECITSPLERERTLETEEPEETDPLELEPKAAYQRHKPCSIGLLLVCRLDEASTSQRYEQHFGEDSPAWFLRRLADIEEECMAVLSNPKRLVMSEADELRFRSAQECYVCRKAFHDDSVKVRDHDHVTGRFRGAAHQVCNLLLRKQYKIPVFFHNFRGYDAHLLVAALGKDAQDTRMNDGREHKLRVIGQGMEKYLTLSYGDHIVIKDSLQFMADSLEGLTTCLRRTGDEKFIRLRDEFAASVHDAAQWQLLLRKGVYPYDYMDSEERFSERALPPIEAFYNRLRQEECHRDDYEHAQAVWQSFGCETLKDYHDLYLKTDILLLADIFQEFRSVCLANYGLDPAHYVSAPHLSWDAMLKSTGCKLELLSDPEMYRLLESGLRGGVAMVSKRFAKANNRRVSSYEPEKPDSHLMYWDANNLYGWAMSQPLPEGGFRWLEDEEIEALDWQNVRNGYDSDLGYIVECDLDYPEQLHDAHNDYPLAPERLTVTARMWSGRQRDLHGAYWKTADEISPNTSSTKLVPNLYPKTRYCLHSRNLKFYLDHGMKLLKVHRAIEFRQSAWMRVYIEKNQNLRAAANSEFEKNFYKLMNNACYGKTCENMRKRTHIQLVTDAAKAQKLLAMPHLLGFRVFTSEIAAIEMMKPRCIINRPFYVGFTVLEFAKLHMYRFHYDFVKQLWPGHKAQLLFTDTDSLMYEVEDAQLYEKVWQHREEFDLSDYPKDFYHDPTNKAIIGKFKDEAKGMPAEAFVGLRAKMYCWKLAKVLPDQTMKIDEKARAKGIQRAAMRNIRFADYERQVFAPEEHTVVNRRIGAHLHRIYTYEYGKKGLCAFDDKRYILEDGISTLAYGHFRVKLENGQTYRALTASDTQPAQTFAEATRTCNIRSLELQDDDEDFDRVEMLAEFANQRKRVRPGFDPEQLTWKARKQNLDEAFAGEDPLDMLDLLSFVA